MNLFRSFSKFVPYTLRYNLDVQIPLLKNYWHLTFFSVRPLAYGVLSHLKLNLLQVTQIS